MSQQVQDNKRTGFIVNSKYSIYVIPALLSAVGVSLSEFADSLLVSRLLNAESFAIVNLGTPIVFMASMLYCITGMGGSLLYAEYLAKKERESADTYFTTSMLLSLICGILLVVLFLTFHSRLGSFFGCPEELRADFDRYIFCLSFFAPVGVLLMAFTYYLPIVGKPFLSMALVIMANVLNIILDVVLIRFVGMDCTGAALATLLSYLISLAAGFLICWFCKVPLRLCWKGLGWKQIKEVIKKGFPSGIVQAGYAMTTIFCNHFMNLSFGVPGVLAMSLFGQMDSVVSIALSGTLDNNASFAAMLKGEGDYYGIRHLSRNVTLSIILICTVMSFCFAVFSQRIAGIFNIHDPLALTLIAKLTPIYVLYYPIRAILLVLRDLYNAMDRSAYASLLGTLDKVVSIPLVGGCLFLALGGYGVIASFPVSIVLILLTIMIINHHIVKKSGGRYSPILLLDEQNPMKALCSFTVQSPEDASAVGISIEKGIKDYLQDAKAEGNDIQAKNVESILDRKTLNRICLAVEEICIYILESCGKDTPIDIMLSSTPEGITITCRNAGVPFYPIRTDSKDLSANELLLTQLFKIKHEYIMGLNSTSLTVK